MGDVHDVCYMMEMMYAMLYVGVMYAILYDGLFLYDVCYMQG
jgi:hypothetical protein